MKRRKIISVVAILILCIGLIAGSLVIGYKFGKNVSGEKKDTKQEQIDVRTIAIVNLDEGIVQDKEIINYANKLIDYSDENLISTSLEDARNGVESGKYAAYVIIPATFSENINSINGKPVESEIQYKLYNNLTSDAGLSTISNIFLLMDDLNNNVSYMYVDSILNEFHIAQDSVEEVLNNDKAISEAVSEVNPEDISTRVQLPSTEREDYTPSSVDYASYLKRNSELISDINNEYSNGYSKSVKEKEELTTAADNLGDSISATNSKLKDIDVETDEEGNYIYDTELKELTASLNNYNNSLNTSMEQITTNMQDICSGLSTYESQLDNLSGHYSDTLEKYNNDIMNNLDILSTSLSEGSYVLKLNNENIKSYRETEDQSVIKNVRIIYSDNDSQIYELIDDEGNINTNSLNDVIKDIVNKGCVVYTTGSGVEIKDTSSLLEELKEKVPAINADDTYSKDESGNYEKLEDSIASEITSIKSGLNDFSTTVETMKSSEIAGIDSDSIVEGVKESVVDKLSENAKNITSTIADEYESEAAALSTFNNNLTNYDPYAYIDQKAIQKKSSDLSDNTSELETAVGNKDSSDMEALGNAFVKYLDNIEMLKESITSAVELSNNAVEQGLKDAQSTLVVNNSRNTDLLGGFSQKLSYTRNGSIGNYQAYNFIVNPCEIVNIGEGESRIVKEETVAKDKKDSTIQVPLIYVIGILGLLVVCNIVIFAVLYGKQNDGNYNL